MRKPGEIERDLKKIGVDLANQGGEIDNLSITMTEEGYYLIYQVNQWERPSESRLIKFEELDEGEPEIEYEGPGGF